jgi:Tfp pilus assembly protein PilW
LKTPSNIQHRRGAYTLIELLVAVSAAAAIFITILTSGVAIYRSCTTADDYSLSINDHSRAADYLTRDLRNALTVAIAGGGTTLTITQPDCYSSYDSEGNPTGPLVNPVVTDGLPNYGDPTAPITITYWLSGGVLQRELIVPSASVTTRLSLAQGVSAFNVSFVPLRSSVVFSLSFPPKNRPGIAATLQESTITDTVAVRMMRAKLTVIE